MYIACLVMSLLYNNVGSQYSRTGTAKLYRFHVMYGIAWKLLLATKISRRNEISASSGINRQITG